MNRLITSLCFLFYVFPCLAIASDGNKIEGHITFRDGSKMQYTRTWEKDRSACSIFGDFMNIKHFVDCVDIKEILFLDTKSEYTEINTGTAQVINKSGKKFKLTNVFFYAGPAAGRFYFTFNDPVSEKKQTRSVFIKDNVEKISIESTNINTIP